MSLELRRVGAVPLEFRGVGVVSLELRRVGAVSPWGSGGLGLCPWGSGGLGQYEFRFMGRGCVTVRPHGVRMRVVIGWILSFWMERVEAVLSWGIM